MEYTIVGAYPYLYVGETVEGHNCNFTRGKAVLQNHKICLEAGGKHYTLTLKTVQSICGSGWCTATYGYFKLEEIDTRSKITLLPKTEAETEVGIDTSESFGNDLFYYSEYGGDSYYPGGGAGIHEEMWEKK